MAHRPDKEDLQERNILKDDSVAPALQAAKEALEHEIIADSLEKKLAQRPDKEDLEERNILKDGS